jgi:hypothetical protein
MITGVKPDFNFFLPIDFEKAQNKKGEKIMKIKGIASTSDEDSEGEILEPIGFDLSRFLEIGYLNYNHGAKNDVGKIIGEPTLANITPAGELYVEGFLYSGHPLAESVWNLAETLQKNGSNRKIGFSIEGRATARDPVNPKRITKALLTGLAITSTPVNGKTYLDICKGIQEEDFTEFKYDHEAMLEKAENSDLLYEFDLKGRHFTINKSFELNEIEKDYKSNILGKYGVDILNIVEDVLQKGGEGSKGGKVIGHTKSGKPIYESVNHPDHKDFSKEDHRDAAEIHEKNSVEILSKPDFPFNKKHHKELQSSENGYSYHYSRGFESKDIEKTMDVESTRALIPESLDKKPKVLEPNIKKAILAGIIPKGEVVDILMKCYVENDFEEFMDEDTGEMYKIKR